MKYNAATEDSIYEGCVITWKSGQEVVIKEEVWDKTVSVADDNCLKLLNRKKEWEKIESYLCLYLNAGTSKKWFPSFLLSNNIQLSLQANPILKWKSESSCFTFKAS